MDADQRRALRFRDRAAMLRLVATGIGNTAIRITHLNVAAAYEKRADAVGSHTRLIDEAEERKLEAALQTLRPQDMQMDTRDQWISPSDEESAYRCYVFNSKNHLFAREVFHCNDDPYACAKAEVFKSEAGAAAFQLWHGTRCVRNSMESLSYKVLADRAQAVADEAADSAQKDHFGRLAQKWRVLEGRYGAHLTRKAG
jgi:hypothetical protein